MAILDSPAGLPSDNPDRAADFVAMLHIREKQRKIWNVCIATQHKYTQFLVDCLATA
jgi:hypothetical protein